MHGNCRVFIDGKPLIFYKNKKNNPVWIIYRKFHDQKTRCGNKKCKSYMNYGAKGIKVEYTFLELYGWVKKKTKKELNCLEIGRIDHSKNYSLDNIELVTKSENTKERNNRLGNPIPPQEIMIYDFNTKRDLCIAPSIGEAAYLTKDHIGSVSRFIKNPPKIKHKDSKHNFGFRFTGN